MHLYIIENSVNSRVYVGITTRSLAKRWAEHMGDARRGVDRALYKAMRKYGIEKFTIRSVETADSWDDLCLKEIALLKTLKKKVKYNYSSGGDGCAGYKIPEVTRKKMRLAHLGKKLSSEHRAKLSAAKTGKKMPPRSTEHSRKISEGLKAAWKRRSA